VFYGSQKAYSPIEDKITEADCNAIKNKAIEELPPRRKIIFEMSRNKGMSYKEIGKELNISLSTVKGQMNKALSGIRDCLQTHGDVALSIAIVLLQLFEIGRNFKKYYSRAVLTLTSSV
jgi:DNA-directed RNA polymerase specialized sigma24 family protein